MRKIVLSFALIATASIAFASTASANETMYKSHLHPDGKLHCFDTGSTCISWPQQEM